MPGFDPADAVDTVAHIVQVALTPVFLLSGIGALLNVFNTRLARVSDHREHLAELLKGDVAADEEPRLRSHFNRLQRRTFVLDVSVILGAIGGASTCGAAFVLFLGSLRNAVITNWLLGLFGSALTCSAVALLAFVGDSVLAWHGLHRDGSMPRIKNQ